MLPWLLLNTITRARWLKFAQSCRLLHETQTRLLHAMVRRNAETAFGRAHNFKQITGTGDFQRQVPIGDWNAFAPYIDRIVAGEANLLTVDPAPVIFNTTSGTTGKPKLIPVYRGSIRGNLTSEKLWAYRAIRDHPRFCSGKVVPVVNRAVEGYTRRGIPYGSVSGLMFRDAPPVARRFYAYPYEALEIEDHRTRWYAIMRLSLGERVTCIVGSTPNSILKLFELADECKEALLRDIHDGTLSIAGASGLHDAVAPRLRRDPDRARQLERGIARSGALRPCEYWPEMQLIGCWIGGTVAQFSQQLRDWCPPETVLRDTGYISSEAHVTIPISDGRSEGLLSVHANFFEFVPEAEFGRSDGRALLAHELEVGRTYHILLTTCAGLYRYNINDVVEVADFHHGAPLVRFLRKGRDIIDIQGEKVTANQVVAAMDAALAASGCRCSHYLLVGDRHRARLQLHVEFAGEPPPAAQQRELLQRFERHLGELNFVFADIRSEKLLGPTVLRVMRRGWFDAIAREMLSRGMRDTQFKPTVVGWETPCPEMIADELDPARAMTA